MQLYPAFAGSVVLAYRIDEFKAGSPPLNFTRDLIVDIYQGNVKMWNDPKIVALNPAVCSLFSCSLCLPPLNYIQIQLASRLPAQGIVLVYRSDSSGTTNIFSTALKAFSPSWTQTGTLVNWTVPGIYGSVFCPLISYFASLL